MSKSYPDHKSEGAAGAELARRDDATEERKRADAPGQPRPVEDSSGQLVAADHPGQVAFEYAPAPESRAIVHLQPSYGLFINGAFVEPVDGNAYKTENPATEEVLAEIAAAGLEDVDRAVEAAAISASTSSVAGFSVL